MASRSGAALLLMLSTSFGTPAAARSPEQFYRGKQIAFIIGCPPGSGYDIDAWRSPATP